MAEIVDYEVMGGWPVYKLTLKEILTKIGFTDKNGTFGISSDSQLLDIYPALFEDDGMGYGVNEMFITDASSGTSKDKDYITMFRSKVLPKIELWSKTHFHPYAHVYNKVIKGWVDLKDIRVTDNGKYEILCWDMNTQKTYDWFLDTELSWHDE